MESKYISFYKAKKFLSEKFGKTPTDADFWMWGFFGKENGGIDVYLGHKNRDGDEVYGKNYIAGSHQFDSISRCINDSILFRSCYMLAELEQFQPVWYITADELLKRWTERFDDEGNAKSYIEQYATEWADYDDLVPRLRNQFVGANPGVKPEFEPFAGVYLFEDVLSVEKYADFPPEKFASSGLPDYSPNPQTQAETGPELQVDAVGDADRKERGVVLTGWQIDASLTKLEKQRKAILETIELKGFDAMAIPDGEKGKIEDMCRVNYPLLFNAESSFVNAWKKSRDLFRMANHASFAKRGRQ